MHLHSIMEVSLWHTALFAVDSLGRQWGGRHWKKELGTVYPFKEGKRNVPVYLYKIFNELHDKHAHTHTHANTSVRQEMSTDHLLIAS